MKNTYTKALAATALASLLSFANVGNALGYIYSPVYKQSIPKNLLDSKEGYESHDITAVLVKRVNPNINIAGSINIGSDDKRATDEVKAVIAKIRAEAKNNHNSTLVVTYDLNVGNHGHFTALAIVPDDNGNIKVIYNDPLNTALASKKGYQNLKTALKALGPNVEIIDLQIKLQQDGTSCGAFTAETLAVLAELDLHNLSEAEIRAKIAKIGSNAKALRKSHYDLFVGNNNPNDKDEDILDVIILKPAAEKAAAEVTHQVKQLLSNLHNVTALTKTRISHLNRTSNFSGLASGDDIIRHGVWVKGFAGTETDKSKNSAKDAVKTKSKTQGAIVGVDTKVTEDITVGIAYSHVNSNSKDTTAGKSSGKAAITSDIASIYASADINNNVSLDGTIAYGATQVKNTNTSGTTNTSTKTKGNLAGATFTANYNLHPNQNVLVTPRVGVAYNQLELKAHNDGALKVAKLNQRELELSTGVVVSCLFDMGGLNLIPEANIDYRHAVWRKGGNLKMTNKLGQVVLNQKNSDAKGSYHAGLGLTAIYNDSLEIGGGYEYSKQGKAQGHMGYAKLRINF